MGDRDSYEGADNPAFQADEPGDLPAKGDGGGGDGGDDAPAEGGEQRQQWGSGLEFLMSCIAMSVGLGNVWRFPFTAYENGGGAFLIPYIIVLVVIGRPLYYLEMGIGQFTSRSCIKSWNMAPALRGVGYGQIAASACVMTYYSSVMAITVLYFIYSFQKNLPWADCDGVDLNNITCGEYFFTGTVLHELPLDEGLGTVNWRLALCLLATWLLVLGVVIRGVSSSGKAAYFLAMFPYVVMVVLLVRGCTLPGAGEGMLYFVKPRWEDLLKPQVWHAAVTQAFFSLNVGFGSLINYASFNDFRHNIYRDAMIVTTMDTFTSLLAGCTIFAILGNLAHETGGAIETVVKSGAGLAFISYPDAIAKFDAVPQLFAVLFFLMLLSLGLGSAVALVSVVVTIITDNFPELKRWAVMLTVCVISFGISIIYVTQGGQSILNLVDHFGVTYPVLAIMCVEVAAISWLYGLDNICNDLSFMLRRPTGSYWRLTWGLITPVFLIVVLVYAAVEDERLEYGKDNFYPDHYYAVGWTITGLVVSLVPIFICIEVGNRFLVQKMPFRKALLTAFQPSPEWGPTNTRTRAQWRAAKADLALLAQGESFCAALTRKLGGCGALDYDFAADDSRDAKAPGP